MSAQSSNTSSSYQGTPASGNSPAARGDDGRGNRRGDDRKNRGAAGGVYLRWTPADIAVGAVVGVACGVIFQGFNFIYPVLSSLLGAILPGLASLFHAIW